MDADDKEPATNKVDEADEDGKDAEKARETERGSYWARMREIEKTWRRSAEQRQALLRSNSFGFKIIIAMGDQSQPRQENQEYRPSVKVDHFEASMST